MLIGAIKPKKMSKKIIILGAARSGTKIFRDCLGAASNGVAIPYDIGYVWRYGNEYLAHDEIPVSAASPRIASFVDNSLEAMASKKFGSRDLQFTVEKSVPNVLRPGFIHALLPSAKFIRIVRRGDKVIESAMRNWERPSDRGYFFEKLRYFPMRNYNYALWFVGNRIRGLNEKRAMNVWGPRYDGILKDAATLPLVDVCSRQWSRCVDICDEQLAAVPDDLVMNVRYEDLISNQTKLRDICDFAGIPDWKAVDKYFARNFDHKRADARVSAMTPQERERIEILAGSSMRRLGYV